MRISQKRARVLLAILATAKGHKKPRSWLKTQLWSGRSHDNNSNNFRQILNKTRNELNEFAHCLAADMDFIWLQDVECQITPDPDYPNHDFFEDAPVLPGEPHEKWLQQERAAFCNRKPAEQSIFRDKEHEHGALKDSAIPKLLVCAASTGAIDPGQAVLSDQIGKYIETIVASEKYFQILDHETTSMSETPPDIILRHSLTGFADTTSLCIQIVDPEQHLVMWSCSLQNRAQQNFSLSQAELIDFLHLCIEKLNHATFLEQTNPEKTSPSLYGIITDIFSIDAPRVDSAITVLQDMEGEARHLSWQAFAFMMKANEILDRERGMLLEQARALFERALQINPHDHTTLALFAHYQAFCLGDFAQADYLSTSATRACPISALAWDARAMLAVYTDKHTAALDYAATAAQFGKNGPAGYYIEASLMMALSNAGYHRQALNLSTIILLKKPTFRPALEYGFTNAVLAGAPGRAKELYTRKQASDHTMIVRTDDAASSLYRSQCSRDLFDKARNIFHNNSNKEIPYAGSHPTPPV